MIMTEHGIRSIRMYPGCDDLSPGQRAPIMDNGHDIVVCSNMYDNKN